MRLFKIKNKENAKTFIGIENKGMFLDMCFAKYRDNPKLCPPLTEDIEKFGDDAFKTSIIEFSKDVMYLIDRQLEEIAHLDGKAYNQGTPPLAVLYDVK